MLERGVSEDEKGEREERRSPWLGWSMEEQEERREKDVCERSSEVAGGQARGSVGSSLGRSRITHSSPENAHRGRCRCQIDA